MTTTLKPNPVAQRPGTRQDWVAPLGLVAISLVPLSAGVLRLVQLSGGPHIMPADPRFAGSAIPVVVHIVGSLVFALAGAAQFVTALRRRGHSWHRRAGRVVAIAGLLVGLSALWLTLFYPAKPGTGELLYFLRLLVAPAMVGSLVLGFAAIRRHDIRAHKAWMVRAYAMGLGAGTQAFTEGFGQALFGVGVLQGDIAKGLAWVINLAVAEWVIRRGQRPPRPSRAVARSAS